jgi:hypothetical protein
MTLLSIVLSPRVISIFEITSSESEGNVKAASMAQFESFLKV